MFNRSKWVIDYAKRAAVRRIVYLLIAGLIALLASYCNAANAQGTQYPDCYGPTPNPSQQCADMQHARAAVDQLLNDFWSGSMAGTPFAEYNKKCFWTNYPNRSVAGAWSNSPNCGAGPSYATQVNMVFRHAALGCPAGTVYDPVQTCKTLCDTGSYPDPSNPGQCLSDSQCTAKNVDQQGVGSRGFKEKCIAGCLLQWQSTGGYSSKKEIWNPNGTSSGVHEIFTGKFQYVRACSMESTPPDQQSNDPEVAQPSENECVQVGNQTACIKPDGKMCAKASTGREFCWNPHETGQKTDKDIVQVKKPGEGQVPETLALSNGDTATKATDDIVIKDTKGTQTSTTTVSTYATASGANAGASNQGSSAATGTGAGAGPGGTDVGEEDDPNTSGGGGDCDTPPQSSGDPLLAQIARQAWETRCEFRRAGKSLEDQATELQSQNDASADPEKSDLWAESGTGQGDGLNQNLVSFGSSCPPPPQLSFMDAEFKWPNGFCDTLAIIRALVIASAFVAAARIIMRG